MLSTFVSRNVPPWFTDSTQPVYAMLIVSPFEGLSMSFVDCAPTAAVTDMATTAVPSIQFVLIVALLV
jgi:hypothetical protein